MFSFTKELDIPAAFAVVENLSDEELRELLNNEQKFEDVLTEIKQLKDLESEKNMIIASNRTLAESNLSVEPDLLLKKQFIRELCEVAESLCLKVKEKVAELREKSGGVTRDTFKMLLETAARESEEASEAIIAKFFDRELNVGNFLDEFLRLRVIMHLRRVKFDKLPEIRQQGVWNVTSPVAYPTDDRGDSHSYHGFYPTY